MEGTNVTQSKLQRAVIEKIRTAGSQNEAARILGISPAHLLNIRDGQWDKVSGRLINELSAKLMIKGDWATAETPDYRKIIGLCMHAQSRGISKAISDNPGTGKTYALKEYASQYGNVYYIECDEYWTKKVFLEQLRTVMGLKEPGLTMHEMVMEICDYLNGKDKPLVIIDEADKLKDGILNFYKTLFNKTNCGFILSGAPYFEKRINKGVRLQKQAYQEIHSRLGKEFIHLKGVSNGAIKLVCEANGIVSEADIIRVINTAHGDLRRVKAEIEQLRAEISVRKEKAA